MLEINPEKVRQVIDEARMFDAEDGPLSGSSEPDGRSADILQTSLRDAVQEELMEFIRSLDEDEQVDLVALAWVGRGTYDISEWKDACAEARRAHNKRTAEYLLSLPKLGDYLEDGLAAIEEAEEAEDE